MGVVGKSQRHFEHLQRVLVGRRESPVNERRPQYLVERVEGGRTEEAVLLAAQHADGGEKSRGEPAAQHAALPERLAIEIGRAREREDCAQVRRLLQRRAILLDGEIAHADHADLTVAPRLRRHPFDQVVEVGLFHRSPEVVGPFASAGAAAVGDHMRVAARHEEIALPSFHEASRDAETLHLSRVWRQRDQGRKSPGVIRTIDVGPQPDPVAHWNGDAGLEAHGEFWPRQVAILPARGLDAGELALSRLGTRARRERRHALGHSSLARIPYHWNCS